jgi:hypothetical protein
MLIELVDIASEDVKSRHHFAKGSPMWSRKVVNTQHPGATLNVYMANIL